MTWIETYTGRKVEPLNLRPEDVCIEDIAHALSMLCRFNGHCRRFYSVAEHSVRVSRLLRSNGVNVERLALIHDAHEAYLGDVVGPLKPVTHILGSAFGGPAIDPRWRVEGIAQSRIERALDVSVCFPDPIPRLIHRADLVMLATERRDLMPDTGNHWPCLDGIDPDPEPIEGWPPERAEREFLARWEELTGGPA